MRHYQPLGSLAPREIALTRPHREGDRPAPIGNIFSESMRRAGSAQSSVLRPFCCRVIKIRPRNLQALHDIEARVLKALLRASIALPARA